jgi:hypothetical protein
MIKTKIKKVLAATAIAALATTQFANVFAASNIGTGSVTGDISFDTNIIWDDAFPGSATGTVTGIVVKAQVLPTLNMVISDKEIDLGVLTAGTPSTGTLDIEVGTNAANGVTIRVKSASGGLTNTSDNALQINNALTDGSQENYTFASTANAIDSTVTGFVTTGDLASTEVVDSSELIIYDTNKPEISDGTDADVTFTVSATSNAQTPAGNYQDTLDFTVIGNF